MIILTVTLRNPINGKLSICDSVHCSLHTMYSKKMIAGFIGIRESIELTEKGTTNRVHNQYSHVWTNNSQHAYYFYWITLFYTRVINILVYERNYHSTFVATAYSLHTLPPCIINISHSRDLRFLIILRSNSAWNTVDSTAWLAVPISPIYDRDILLMENSTSWSENNNMLTLGIYYCPVDIRICR